ncbi:hypothetical protein GCM10008174_23800 [Methylopila turkensis]|uniref:Uncharacterized protein n=1 Tax=Methylopila turkensis TaxID=1437816 RepID=A0A9W6JQR1_9HYPH|nr:hypothetical protein GCM10008174_23800 [Methylopila turkensis]
MAEEPSAGSVQMKLPATFAKGETNAGGALLFRSENVDHAAVIASARKTRVFRGRRRRIAIFIWTRRGMRRDQIAKLVPQPQEAVAFGFRIWNEAPIRSSTKSISEPAR